MCITKKPQKKSDRAAVEQQKYEQGKSAAKRRRAAENNGKKKNPWRGDEDFEPEPTGLTSAQGLRGRDRGGLTGVHNATSGNPILAGAAAKTSAGNEIKSDAQINEQHTGIWRRRKRELSSATPAHKEENRAGTGTKRGSEQKKLKPTSAAQQIAPRKSARAARARRENLPGRIDRTDQRTMLSPEYPTQPIVSIYLFLTLSSRDLYNGVTCTTYNSASLEGKLKILVRLTST
jgi:hypothetical protein